MKDRKRGARGKGAALLFADGRCPRCREALRRVEAALVESPAGAPMAWAVLRSPPAGAAARGALRRVHDPGGRLFARMGVGSLPSLLLVEPGGRVAEAFAGLRSRGFYRRRLTEFSRRDGAAPQRGFRGGAP